MPSVLIVGANRGIGLGLAQAYHAAGFRVHATARQPAKARALRAIGDDLHLYELEVRDQRHGDALARALEGHALDVLIHNAGVYGERETPEEVMAINAEAPIHLAEQLLPALERGEGRKLVLMTSQLGARRGRSDSLGVYGDSKAALNDTFRERASAWRARGIHAIVMHPGWVRTDMGGKNATLSVEESVEGILKVVEELGPANHGRFLTWEGNEHPW